MAHYVKLFDSIIHSTLWQKDLHIKVVWIAMLAMADNSGEVHASVPGLAKAAGVNIEQCEEALKCFLAPDPYSRSKEAEGRRIAEIRGGWELINYRYYRSLKSVEQERENAAERQQRARDRKKEVTERHAESHESLHVEEEGDEEGDGKTTTTPSLGGKLKKPRKVKGLHLEHTPEVQACSFTLFEKYPKEWEGQGAVPSSSKSEVKQRTHEALEEIKKLGSDIPAIELLTRALDAYLEEMAKAGRYLVGLEVWLSESPRKSANGATKPNYRTYLEAAARMATLKRVAVESLPGLLEKANA